MDDMDQGTYVTCHLDVKTMLVPDCWKNCRLEVFLHKAKITELPIQSPEEEKVYTFCGAFEELDRFQRNRLTLAR